MSLVSVCEKIDLVVANMATSRDPDIIMWSMCSFVNAPLSIAQSTLIMSLMLINSLSPGRYGLDFAKMCNLKHNLRIDISSIQININWNEFQGTSLVTAG